LNAGSLPIEIWPAADWNYNPGKGAPRNWEDRGMSINEGIAESKGAGFPYHPTAKPPHKQAGRLMPHSRMVPIGAINRS
jgi:hypothetical protein